jgi:hypothetical protein
VARRADLARLIGLALAVPLIAAAPPDPAPGFDTAAPAPPAFAQPRHDAPLDPVIAQLVVARLVQLRLLGSADEAQDAAKAADAVKGFQAGVGLKPTGLLDRKTIAMLAL